MHPNSLANLEKGMKLVKGVSGNPGGKPHLNVTLAMELRDALAEITSVDDLRRKIKSSKMTGRRLFVLTRILHAITGKNADDIWNRHDGLQKQALDVTGDIGEKLAAAMDQLVRNINGPQGAGGSSDARSGPDTPAGGAAGQSPTSPRIEPPLWMDGGGGEGGGEPDQVRGAAPPGGGQGGAGGAAPVQPDSAGDPPEEA
ncbi:MAG: hypothetical protein LLG93_00320 [Deltaproteobacteria bacterium]|nr:hypothetical protein [Deltaproteobacteria bacterium]